MHKNWLFTSVQSIFSPRPRSSVLWTFPRRRTPLNWSVRSPTSTVKIDNSLSTHLPRSHIAVSGEGPASHSEGVGNSDPTIDEGDQCQHQRHQDQHDYCPHIHEHLKYFMNFSVHHQKHNCLSPFDTTNIYGDFQDVSKMIFSSLSES